MWGGTTDPLSRGDLPRGVSEGRARAASAPRLKKKSLNVPLEMSVIGFI